MVKKIFEISQAPNKICSIDASTNNLAFAVFEGKSLVSHGKISFAGLTAYEKVVDAAKKCREFFKLFPDIDAIVIEHTVFMNSPRTAADLALVQGALLGAAGVPKIKSVAPITWQNFIGNKKMTTEEKLELRGQFPGKSDSWYKTQEREIRKQKTIHFIDVVYDKQVSDNDVADAIAIGHYAVSNWERLTK